MEGMSGALNGLHISNSDIASGKPSNLSTLPSQPELDERRKAEERIDLKGGRLGEIYVKIMAAIEEHKSVITEEYKTLKRTLDLERGNKRSQVKLARKNKRSKKHVEQLEKAEHNMKSDHMHQLHDTLMRHHFSLSKVEEQCMIALQDECLKHIQSVNKAELSIWKRTCQDLHDTLDIPVKAFTTKGKCKRIAEISDELRAVILDGEAQLTKLYLTSSIEIGDGDGEDKNCYKTFMFLHDALAKISMLCNDDTKKKHQVKRWPGFGEEMKEMLGKYTQLLKYQQNHRIEQMMEICAAKLRKVQKAAARRHGKLMQKVAREQELLDRERAEMRAKHGDRKSNRKSSDMNMKPPMQMTGLSSMLGGNNPYSTMMAGLGGLGGGMPGLPQMGGMGGMMNGMGGMGGMGAMGGMNNYNMSNAVDLEESSGEDNRTEIPINQEAQLQKEDRRDNPLMYQYESGLGPPPMLFFKHLYAFPIHHELPIELESIRPQIPIKDLLMFENRGPQGRTGMLSPMSWLPCKEALHSTCYQKMTLTQDVVQRIPAFSRRSNIERFLMRLDTPGRMKKNFNINAASSTLSGIESSEYLDKNKNINADSDSSSSDDSSSEGTGTAASSSKSKSQSESSKSGSSSKPGFAARLFGSKSGSSTASSKAKTEPSKTDKSKSQTAKTDKSAKSSALSSVSKKSTPGDGGGGEKPANYKEFIPNEHKDRGFFSFKRWCGCCTMDNFVKTCCPCFRFPSDRAVCCRNRWDDYKEKRAMKRERKEMQKNVLLRLRDEARRDK